MFISEINVGPIFVRYGAVISNKYVAVISDKYVDVLSDVLSEGYSQERHDFDRTETKRHNI